MLPYKTVSALICSLGCGVRMIVSNPLVSIHWLYENLHQKNLIILDCSWHLPAHNRDAKAEYELGHIKDAQFFDLDVISDVSNPLPHMLPKPEDFKKSVEAMGISNDSLVVLYDGMGVFSSPRVWWMFLVFGVKNIRILNGGLPAWKAQGYELETALKKPIPAHFNVFLNTDMIAKMDDIKSATSSGHQIIDARPFMRFSGQAREPRAGLESGHMPKAHNLPQSDLAKNGLFLESYDLKMAFKLAGVDINVPVITTCGSGVTAASLTLGMAVLGKPIGKLYDGSWAEWASYDNNIIIKSNV